MPNDRRGSATRMVTLARGERVPACRQACMRFWVVVRGTAAMCTSFPDGRRQITSLEPVGSTICGLMAGPDRPTWLEALEDCMICELDFSAHAAALKENAGFLDAMFRVTHERLEVAARQLTTLGRLDSTERVILFLAEMALKANRRGGVMRPARLPMSREDIADYLGLNTETVSRIMGRLKKSGLIRFLSPTEYVVPDMEAVARRLPVPLDVAGHGQAVPGPQAEADIRGVGA